METLLGDGRPMLVGEMVNAFRGVAPGTVVVVTYDSASRIPSPFPAHGRQRVTQAGKRREAAMEKAQLVGLPENVYIGRFCSLSADHRGQILLNMFVFNRGEAGSEGEPRTFNPLSGQLRGVFVLPIAEHAPPPRRAPRPARKAA